MFVLWNHQGHKNIDVEKANHSRTLFRPVQETIDILGGQLGSIGTTRENGNATLEANGEVRNAAEQVFDEGIHLLARLVGQLGEACLQIRVNCEGGYGHSQKPLSRSCSHRTCGGAGRRNRVAPR